MTSRAALAVDIEQLEQTRVGDESNVAFRDVRVHLAASRQLGGRSNLSSKGSLSFMSMSMLSSMHSADRVLETLEFRARDGPTSRFNADRNARLTLERRSLPPGIAATRANRTSYCCLTRCERQL